MPKRNQNLNLDQPASPLPPLFFSRTLVYTQELFEINIFKISILDGES